MLNCSQCYPFLGSCKVDKLGGVRNTAIKQRKGMKIRGKKVFGGILNAKIVLVAVGCSLAIASMAWGPLTSGSSTECSLERAGGHCGI